jgi:D-alanyl-D-alanine carboxypeptidase
MSFSTDDWQWLGDFLKRRGLPGIAIAVNDGDELAFSHSVGWAELRKRAIDEDTLFELGSIGKTFTALLAVELLDLQAALTDYLPWFEVRSAYDPIRVEHLLTHSAGLIRGADTTADSRFDVWALRDTETGFAPGEYVY